MRIRLLTGIAGRGFSHAPGDVVDMDDAEAARLLAAGYAERADEGYEAATAEPEEAATVKPRRRKKG